MLEVFYYALLLSAYDIIIKEEYKEISRYIGSPISETRNHFECSKCQFHSYIDQKVLKNKEKIKRALENLNIE